MLDNYRNSNNRSEILGIIKKSLASNQNYLWQMANEERFVFPVKKVSINQKMMTFQVKVADNNKKMLKVGELTYFHMEYRSSVFKVTILNIINNEVIFFIPQEVYTIEMRKEPRLKFKPKDKFNITLVLSIELLLGATQALKFQVADFSEGGVSLIVDDSSLKYLTDASFIALRKVMETQLDKGCELHLIYSKPIKFKKKGKVQSANRVGLKFNQAPSIECLEIVNAHYSE